MAANAELLAEILAAALGAIEDGLAVLDAESRVLLWNPAAMAISGYHAADLIGRPLPDNLYQIDAQHQGSLEAEAGHVLADRSQLGQLVQLRHERGHTLPAMLRRIPLRDALGNRFGLLLRFHPVEELDTLAHGANEEEGVLAKHLEHSQADMEDRLEDASHEWEANSVPFGLLWITVDQAADLRRTHGRDAVESMLAIVERTLLHALRPTEILARWGSNEFLVLCHERSAEMLAAHAEHVCSLARTADFRWWGDRVDLSIGIGAAQAEDGEKLSELLQRTQSAMQQSERAGGNRVTRATSSTGGQGCSQS